MNTILTFDVVAHVAVLIAAIRVLWLFDTDRVKVKNRVHRLEVRLLKCEQSQHNHVDGFSEDDAAKPVTLHLVSDDEDKSA